MRRYFDNTKVHWEVRADAVRDVLGSQNCSFSRNDRVGKQNRQFAAPFLICCRGFSYVFLLTFPFIRSPPKVHRGHWKWNRLYSSWLCIYWKRRRWKLAMDQCGFIMLAGSSLNAFSNCWVISRCSLLGPSIYIFHFHQSLFCFIVYPYNSWVSPHDPRTPSDATRSQQTWSLPALTKPQLGHRSMKQDII